MMIDDDDDAHHTDKLSINWLSAGISCADDGSADDDDDDDVIDTLIGGQW